MKKIILLLISFLISVNSYTQSCTSTVYFDNMETFTWFGDWWLYNFSDFRNNYSVSPSFSAVHRGNGGGTSNIEEDWYVLPQITGLNSNYTYKVRFKLASYAATAPTALTRGLDGADILQVQLSRNGGVYLPEITISGFDGQLWNYNATGVVSKNADGINSNYGRTGTTRYGICGNCYSTIELILPPNTDSFAIDIYTRCNAAGEEFWIDNIELIEIIPTPTPIITGDSIVCLGDPITLTAFGGDTYSWTGGITNGVSFVPTNSSVYTVTTTLNGMINGNGIFNTCSTNRNVNVVVLENCILPIYLESFNGINQGEKNYLNWITEQELNASHFELERSKNGYDFELITSMLASNSNPYKYIDESPFLGSNYYRLKMIDFDGSYEYSPIIEISVKNLQQNEVYPNPFDKLIKYNFQSDKTDIIEIYIFSILGNLVHKESINTQITSNKLEINTEDLTNGVYRIKIRHLISGKEVNQTIIKR